MWRNQSSRIKRHFAPYMQIAVFVFGTSIYSGDCFSQSANDEQQKAGDQQQEPKDPQLVELEKKQAIAETEAAIAVAEKDRLEAEKASREAKLPTPEAKGLTGDATIAEGAGYFSEIMSYQSLTVGAVAIAEEVRRCRLSNVKVLLTSSDDLGRLKSTHDLLLTKVGDLSGLLQPYTTSPDEMIAEAESLSTLIAAAPLVLGGIAEIAAFFKSDYEIKDRVVEESNQALLAIVSRELIRKGQNVSVVGLTLETTALQEAIDELLDYRGAAKRVQVTSQRTLKSTTEKLADPNIDDTEKQKLGREKESLEQRIAQIQDLDSATTTLLGTLSSSADGKPSLLELVRPIDLVVKNPTARILIVSVLSAGAELHVTKGVWRSAKISHIGGSVVSYTLVAQDGTMYLAGLVPAYGHSSFRGSKGPEGIAGAAKTGRITSSTDTPLDCQTSDSAAKENDRAEAPSS